MMAAPIPSPTPGSARPAIRRRWAGRTTLLQFRRPAFWLYSLILLGTGVYTGAEQNLFREVSPSGFALSWALLAVYAFPVLALVYVLDLYEREPPSLVFGSLLWGAVAATTLAGIANDGWGLLVSRIGGPEFAARWTPALTAPWVEETLKGLGVVLIYLIARDEMDDVMDGFVYGAVCGLGFAVVEDVFYFMAVFGGKPADVLAGFYVRVISSGFYGHVLYTGLSGMGIAYFVSRRDEVARKSRFLVAAGLCLSGVAGHFLWNSPWLDLFPKRVSGIGDWLLIPLAAAVKSAPLVAFLVVMARLARAREHRWLRVSLGSEIGGVGVLAGEMEVLEDPRRRRRARREMQTRAGVRAASLLKRLQKEQINLAMVRARVWSDDDPDLVRQRGYCKSLRDALSAIPGASPATAEITGGPAIDRGESGG